MTVIGIVYYINSNYFGARHLDLFYPLIKNYYVLIIILCCLYFIWVDCHQENPYDEYWVAGCFFLWKMDKKDSHKLKKFVCDWFVKGFFIPYVIIYLIRYGYVLAAVDFKEMNFLMMYNYLLDLFYTVDVAFAVLGYVFTCRLLDTHIRSTDPTILGWIVCFMCYGAFNSYFGIGLLHYDDSINFYNYFSDQSFVYYVIGGLVIFLSLIYCLSTVAIGYRMSNLTFRGVITDGPYRFTKHPAYIGKLGAWWLVSLPFLTAGNMELAVKHTGALIIISTVYFLRAKTEENHLSNYPEYVEYANWINENGIFSGIMKKFPRLQYSYEKTKKWESKVGK